MTIRITKIIQDFITKRHPKYSITSEEIKNLIINLLNKTFKIINDDYRSIYF